MATSATWLINMLAKFHEKDPATARGRDFTESFWIVPEPAADGEESGPAPLLVALADRAIRRSSKQNPPTARIK
jgi:hypothetical protein